MRLRVLGGKKISKGDETLREELLRSREGVGLLKAEIAKERALVQAGGELRTLREGAVGSLGIS